MSEEPTQTPASAPQPSVRTLDWLVVLPFLKDYFALISAVAIVVGVTLATVFLYAYLSVFDWHLLWTVQYQDILTFALVAIGVVGASATFLGSLIEGVVLHTGLAKGKPNWTYITALALAYLALLALTIFAEHKKPEPHYTHIFFAWISGVAFVLVVITSSRIFYLGIQARGWLIAWTMISLLFGAYTVGMWLGYSVLETTDYDHDVYLKNQTLNRVKIILVMSHHTILYKDKAVYVFPTADVSQIVSTRHQ
jgi:hypothetical protein